MWERTAILHGVDVARFENANDDGMGDLAALIDRLDYIAELGVDCLWILPYLSSARPGDGSTA